MAVAATLVVVAMASVGIAAGPAGATLPPYPGPNPTFNAQGPQGPTDAAAVVALNAARAGEGLGPVVLPTNWGSLSYNEQMITIVNLERTARGGPPLAGLNANLDSAAQGGANAGTDPSGAFGVGAVWAGGQPTPLDATLVWIYIDGYNSGNTACPTPTSNGCWLHRVILLSPYYALNLTTNQQIPSLPA